jgi:protoporphyrinogen oxidase
MHITILGGGTAGWIAALMLCKNHPNHTFSVVASKSVGIL